MINLLPPQHQKQIYREYQLRIVTIILLMLGVVGMSMFAAMVPAYIVLRTASLEQAALLSHKKQAIKPDETNNLATAKTFMAKVNTLKGDSGDKSPYLIFKDTLLLKSPDVAIITLAYNVPDTSGMYVLKIEGRADTREGLQVFKKALENSGKFKNIDLPANTLIKKSDIQFTLTLTSADIKTP